MRQRISTYLSESRDLTTSFILVLPLFVVYQLGILATGGVRNGVDFMSNLLFLAADHQFWHYVGLNLGLLAAFSVAAYLLHRRNAVELGVWPWVVVESTVYALSLGTVVLSLMRNLGLTEILASGGLGDGSLYDQLILSLGAGIYEEIVFRLFLTGGLFVAADRFFGWSKWLAAALAVGLSSLFFSAVHYVGPLGEAFALDSFVFRFLAGALLAVIFYVRGFAVAVYTHAIYDIYVTVLS
ncbi:MAG: type II CAAX prenyl endopeptidase Rce1 family protein [Bradymonadaceae bacterium]